MKIFRTKLLLISSIFFYFALVVSSGYAQTISSDNTLVKPTRVSSQDGKKFIINSGSLVGRNLFHSFDKFSIPRGGAAIFNNGKNVDNIISRVTGGFRSDLDGQIKAHGNANVFLLNPSGILFGPNASLELGGSFLASTADRIEFFDGSFFGINESQTRIALTESLPTSLQFQNSNGSIMVKGKDFCPCLTLKPNSTFALVGNGISFNNGLLRVPEGRIELGSVSSPAKINLLPVKAGWALEYDGVNEFSNISLQNFATLDTSGNFGGLIQIYGNKINIENNSVLASFTLGDFLGQGVIIQAQESLSIFNSFLFSNTLGSGKGGDIKVSASKVIVHDGLISSDTSGVGDAGDIVINSQDYVEVSGQTGFILTQSFSTLEDAGNAGNVYILTDELFIKEGGIITTTSVGPGNTGNVLVNANYLVDIDGRNSGIFSRVRGSGSGGRIQIFSPVLKIRHGAVVDTSTLSEGQGGNIQLIANTLETNSGGQVISGAFGSGDAGSITLNVRDLIKLSGTNSGIFASTDFSSTGDGGDINIDPNLVIISDGAGIGVNSEGFGLGGNINLVAGKLILSSQAFINASSSTNQGGNITLKLDDFLFMRGQSLISANAGSLGQPGDGGNINISADYVVSEPTSNSDIIANSFEGRGGKVNINARRAIFGFSVTENTDPRSSAVNDITAVSLQDPRLNGQVNINNPEVDPSENLSEQPVAVEPPQDIAKGCRPGQSIGGSTFTHVGRGGLPIGPYEAQTPSTVWQDLRAHNIPSTSTATLNSLPTSSILNPPSNIVEAKGWSKDSQGRIYLTANVPQPTQSPRPIATC